MSFLATSYKSAPRRGFSLVEILAVIVLMSLLLAAAVPYLSWVTDKADDDNAINRAVLLNAAKGQYLLEYDYVAHTSFNAKSNANKYLVLKNYLGYAGSTIGAYVPSGYTFGLGNLNTRTAVTESSSGEKLSY